MRLPSRASQREVDAYVCYRQWFVCNLNGVFTVGINSFVVKYSNLDPDPQTDACHHINNSQPAPLIIIITHSFIKKYTHHDPSKTNIRCIYISVKRLKETDEKELPDFTNTGLHNIPYSLSSVLN